MRRDNLAHRASAIAVLSTDGQLLIHRRAAWKDVWPSYWDIAAGGVVEAGEDISHSAARELREELGVSAELRYLGDSWYRDDHVQVLSSMYVAIHDGPFVFDDAEVVEVRFVSRMELVALASTEPFCPDNVGVLLESLSHHGLF